MIKIGSGGANFSQYVNGEWYDDSAFILNRLPIAQANSYEQIFWLLQFKIKCEKPAGLSERGLSRIIT